MASWVRDPARLAMIAPEPLPRENMVGRDHSLPCKEDGPSKPILIKRKKKARKRKQWGWEEGICDTALLAMTQIISL